jgi:hypothetical protein
MYPSPTWSLPSPPLSAEALSTQMNYSDEETRLAKSILDRYDEDSLCIFTGDSAREFIRHTGISVEILGEIWAICDAHCKGFLIREELSLFIRLLGYAQVDHDFRRPACREKGTSGSVPPNTI